MRFGCVCANNAAKRGRSQDKGSGRCEARLMSVERAFRAAEQPLKRKQVFANALKRVNKEIDRLRKFEARTVHVEAARRAFALSRSAKFVEYPAAGKTARDGMQPQVSARRRTTVPRSKIGSVSKATRVSQAIRDARG